MWYLPSKIITYKERCRIPSTNKSQVLNDIILKDMTLFWREIAAQESEGITYGSSEFWDVSWH